MSGRAEGSAEGERGNAVEQCGRLVGYAVEDEDGKMMLVDEHGVPVRKDQAHRKPVPPRLDADGNPQWVV